MFKLAHNESIDLGYSAFIIINKKILSTDRKEFGLHDNQVLDAVEQLENEMTVSRYKQLKSLVNKYIFHTYVVRISCEHPDWTEVEVVAYIRQLSEQEFYEDYLNKQIGEDHNFEDDEIKERIEICTNNNANKEVPSFTTVKYLQKHKKQVQDDIVDFLDYYIPLYLKVKAIGMRIAEDSLLVFQKAFPDLDSFIQGLNFINVDMFEEDINLCGYVTAFMDAGMYIFSVSGTSHMVLGSSLTDLLSDDYKTKKQTSVFKCLADPTKHKILDMLHGEQLCAGDLVTRLDLSKSTVSHHMNQLLSANCIVLSLKEGKKMYYSVNVKFIEETFQNVLDKYSHD